MKTLVTVSMLVGLTTACPIPAMAQGVDVFVTTDPGREGGTSIDLGPYEIRKGLNDELLGTLSLQGSVDRSGGTPSLIRNDMDLCVEAVDGHCSDF